ncbi:helix-turn-helix domain-containing protein [Geodermatophilus sp. SYSU D01106]
MATLVDTDGLDPADRRPGRVAELLEGTMSSRIRFPDPSVPARARLDGWDLGGVSVMRLDLTGEVTLLRTARHARADPEPVLSLAVQEAGTARQEQFGAQREVAGGELSFTEVSSPYEYRWSGRGVCRALRIPAARLGLPVDTVRRALPVAGTSPLYDLVRAHVTQLTRDVSQLAAEPLVHSLASATVDLTRALLASAVDGARGTQDVLGETLLTRVRAYVRRHLTEPDLDAERIARAHAVSVRHLYRTCAAAGLSLEQEVISQRLEGARAELAGPGARSIAVVARRWGFTDPSYFARRFRAEFGVSPREWRDLARGEVLAGAPAGPGAPAAR